MEIDILNNISNFITLVKASLPERFCAQDIFLLESMMINEREDFVWRERFLEREERNEGGERILIRIFACVVQNAMKEWEWNIVKYLHNTACLPKKKKKRMYVWDQQKWCGLTEGCLPVLLAAICFACYERSWKMHTLPWRSLLQNAAHCSFLIPSAFYTLPLDLIFTCETNI